MCSLLHAVFGERVAVLELQPPRPKADFLTLFFIHADINSHQVTCFEYSGQLLPREDPDAAKCLEGALREDGINIVLGVGRSCVEYF